MRRDAHKASKRRFVAAALWRNSRCTAADRFAICQQSSRKTIQRSARASRWLSEEEEEEGGYYVIEEKWKRAEVKAEGDGYGRHSRKGAIDLLQKEAAVSGLFFNKSFENEKERERERVNGLASASDRSGGSRWKNGISPWENGILSASREPSRGVPAVIRASVTLR